MATTVITGRDVTFTIATVAYSEQATSATLTNNHIIETYQTLSGRVYKAVDDDWKFDVEFLSDWGKTASLCKALYTAAETAPNTTLAVVLTAATGNTFTFNVYPTFPSAGGSAPGAQTQSLSFQVAALPVESLTP
jgi:N6-adenosine-specific RNA methylase IME4